ncbi:MAG: hypothetical protein ACXV98_07690 [Ilumatobacteraceae bacterium]
MPGDVSYRSIEIQLSNNTPSMLTVQSANTAGPGATWIGGEQPSGSLSPFASETPSVDCNDGSIGASGRFW